MKEEPALFVKEIIDRVQKLREAPSRSGRPEAMLREQVQPIFERMLESAGARPLASNERTFAVPKEEGAEILDAPLEQRGRADAIYNRFVIEFEPPGSLRASVKHSATQHAVHQVQQYLRGLSEADYLPLDRLAGCAFDGDWIIYINWDGEEWQVARPRAADTDGILVLCNTLVSMAEGRGLTIENLAQDFGREGFVSSEITQALFSTLRSRRLTPRSNELFRQWQKDICAASSPNSATHAAEWRQLCADLGIPSDAEWTDYALFAIQTYFALVAKLIGIITLEGIYGEEIISRIQAETSEGLYELENGTLMSTLGADRVGAVNLIEPGIFSWYIQDNYPSIRASLRNVVKTAGEYSAELGALPPPRARDLLKDLYEKLIPRNIRHRMGEYYTPDWLARRVLKRVVRGSLSPQMSVLDPACGSGTFLVMAAQEMIENSKDSARDTIELLSERLVGFDLSPLAVQAAKVNYLLAVAPILSQTKDSIFIPIYLADSVAPPRRGGLLEGDVYILNTSVGEWHVPAQVVEQPKEFSRIGRIFNEGIAENIESGDILSRIESTGPEFSSNTKKNIEVLYSRIRHLHLNERNGMWWNLVSNAFAPTAYREFDYIIGNPPWVSWETLPDSYREENEQLWRLYQLHPDRQENRGQSSKRVKLDLSMLFTARCVDTYLKAGGKLGFVITASVFRSELSGRGFRGRRLSNGETYRFEEIEDLSNFKVFESASNQTAILIASKETSSQEFPIPATVWWSKSLKTIPVHSTLGDVKQVTLRRKWAVEPVSPSDLLSPLMFLDEEALVLSRPMRRRSAYADVVREGINTRGANGVFFLKPLGRARDGLIEIQNCPDLGRNKDIDALPGTVEEEAAPLVLRGEDVQSDGIEPRLRVLFFHDEEHRSVPISDALARARFPKAYDYASKFRPILKGRRKFRNFDPAGPEWLGLYSVTGATLAEYKVVYREIADQLIAAAVCEKNIVPDHKLYVIPVESKNEAESLAAVLNSPVVRYIARAFSISTSITGSLLGYLGIRRIGNIKGDPADAEWMARILGLSEDAYSRLLELTTTNELENQ